MRIEWVNHASFVLDHGSVRMISDPWLDGTAFGDGWALLSKTQFRPEAFASITHIWYSHEHPDHFSPATIRSIPDEVRARITVMTQATRDRKVVDYCRGAGFKDVVELPTGRWYRLDDDLEIMCQPVKLDDSWLAIRTAETTIVNLNDCLLGLPWEVEEVAAQVGEPIDLLLTQFSYAAWIGNPDDHEMQRAAAVEIRDRVAMQTNVLKPRWVIPFASFVWFCHEENAYMNAEMNRIDEVVEFVRRETEATPIVMYPGDTWQPGASHDPTAAAVARYVEDLRAVPGRPLVHATSHSLGELGRLAKDYGKRMLAFHGFPLRVANAVGRLPATPIWLVDHDCAVELSLRGLRRSKLSRGECDIALTSDALAYALQFNWGGMTLIINGRFSVPGGGDMDMGGPPHRFQRYAVLADDANHGWPMRREIVRRIKERLPLQKGPWSSRHTAPAG